MKKNSNLLKLTSLFVLTIIVCFIAIFMLQYFNNKNSMNEQQNPFDLNDADVLSDEYNAHIFGDWSNLYFSDADGNQVTLNDKMEDLGVLFYWSSWCPHCREELEKVNALNKIITQENGSLILVNKLDGKKETKQTALNYLKENNIDVDVIFDDNCENYDKMGINMVPTTVFIGKNKQQLSSFEGEFPEEDIFMSMMKEAEIGKTKYLEQAIKNILLNEDYGIQTTYNTASDKIPSGRDILSESQGLLMLYAVNADDKELFDNLWNYIKEYSFKNKYILPWVITDKSTINTNAVIDDLRIFRALYNAELKWGGYETILKNYSQALYTYNVKNGDLIDFYDFEANKKASRVTLCYIDFQSLDILKQYASDWQKVMDNGLEIVENGFIDNTFPIYYGWYNYSTKKYEKSDLNMAEAMVTLLNLSRYDKLPPETLTWLREKINNEAIYAKYSIDGRPTLDGRYESTAVYALVAMIAMEENDIELAHNAISKIEKLKIKTINSPFDGAFGQSDGEGIYSFDQCIALLAYQILENRK